MKTTIAQLLSRGDRTWSGRAGASGGDIDRLRALSPVPLPTALIELLRFSDGGEGSLALPPLLFMLDSVSEIVARLRDSFLSEDCPGFLFFGGNGGLESIALDCRSGAPPFPVVMIDLIAGPDSAEEIAPDVRTFVTAIGLEVEDEGD